MATPAPIASLLENRWFTTRACALLTLPFWTSGIAKLLVGLIGGLMIAAVLQRGAHR